MSPIDHVTGRTRAVLFDLDDTLFDHSHAARSALHALQEEHPALRERAIGWLEQEARRLLDELHGEVLAGRVSMEASRVERMRRLFRSCGAAIDEGEASRVAGRYRSVYQESRMPVPGVPRLLRRLKPVVTVGIVSNNLTEEQRDKLICCGLDDFIDFMVTSEEVGVSKPDPIMFDVALKRARCVPVEAVMVGDSWRIDVLGALGAGIRAVWLNRAGAAIPASRLAEEIRGFEPVDDVVETLLEARPPLASM